jgi:hypothetical protein
MDRIYPGIEADRASVAAFCERWRIRELALFGSAARQQLRPDSDIDVMVQFDDDAPWDLFDLVTIKADLEALLGREVDLIEQGTIGNASRRASIERDLRVLYAA